MVCSNWAERLPSSVTTVQLSFHIMGLMLPRVNIGSASVYHMYNKAKKEKLMLMICQSHSESLQFHKQQIVSMTDHKKLVFFTN